MKLIFNEYSVILIFLVIASFLSTIIFMLSYFVTPQKADQEKVSAYECGFNPFDDARATFDIRFYLVAILFLIFDLLIYLLYLFFHFIFQMIFILAYNVHETNHWVSYIRALYIDIFPSY